MLRISTEELIRYYYRETSKQENEVIENALAENPDLRMKLTSLRQSLDGLNDLIESPRPQAVDAILSYARRTA